MPLPVHGVTSADAGRDGCRAGGKPRCGIGAPAPTQKPLELVSATPDAPARCADGGYDGVHARGQTTVEEWAPMPGKRLRVPAAFGPGPDGSTLLYDELVVYEEERLSLAYVLVVEKLGDELPMTTPPEPPKAAASNVSIRELKVDAARYGIDARGMEKADLAAAVDAARAASEKRKLERPAKKRKTERKPPRGKFVLNPDDLSFNLDIKLVPQTEDDRLYALRLRDARYCMKDASEEERQAIEDMPRDKYLATRTQEDRDQLKNEICQYQADIFCNAPIASLCVDDVRYGPWSEVEGLDEAALPPKLEDSAVIFEGPEFGLYDEKADYELKEPLPDGKLTCAAFKDLVQSFERECRTRQSQTGHGLDVSHVCFEGVGEVSRNVYRMYWGS